eukprot:TRINITY_DN2395_c0_g1_i1.p1 TRINITY_DN2395_c0_g1~~TRINITY_DN2395_c0_g1_i1.p1  ORF type:complete len:338 (-),score=71.28 TRINITY_DN2395_c0_g1_i1:29-1042(-)
MATSVSDFLESVELRHINGPILWKGTQLVLRLDPLQLYFTRPVEGRIFGIQLRNDGVLIRPMHSTEIRNIPLAVLDVPDLMPSGSEPMLVKSDVERLLVGKTELRLRFLFRTIPPFHSAPLPSNSVPWAESLKHVVDSVLSDGTASSNEVFFVTDNVVVLYDTFPKSAIHLLLMPRETSLKMSVHELKIDHIPLLLEYRWITRQLESAFKDGLWTTPLKNEKSMFPPVFKIGFHALPSIPHLHCHFILEDYQTPQMKQRKHWNSFATEFFIELDSVIERLTRGLPPSPLSREEYSRILAGPMRCPSCGEMPAGFPSVKGVKDHFATCFRRIEAPLKQ